MTTLLGHFRITVHRAQLDGSHDWVGKVDPYCKVTFDDGLGNELEHETPVANQVETSVGPLFEWADTHIVSGGSTDATLHFEVFDKDLLKSDDRVGQTTLSLSELERQMQEPTVDGCYRVRLELDANEGTGGMLIVVLEPAHVIGETMRLTGLIDRCREQEERLKAIHQRVEKQVKLFAGHLADVRSKEGRESLEGEYQREIERYRSYLGQLERIYNTIWRKRMFLDLRMPLVLLHKRRPCELMLPKQRLDRARAERFRELLEAQIGVLKTLAAEADEHVAGIKRNLVIPRHKVSNWITDDTRTEVNTDRAVMVDAYARFSAQMREVADRHDLALDHLKFQLLRMSSPQIDLSFLQDDLDGMVEATDMAGADSVMTMGMLLDAVPEVPGFGDSGEDEVLTEMHVELEANLAAVDEIESLI